MKPKILLKGLLLIVALLCSVHMWAYIFEQDGTFYETISEEEGERTCMVSCNGWSPSTIGYGRVGYAVIPKTATWNEVSFTWYDPSLIGDTSRVWQQETFSVIKIGERAYEKCDELLGIILPNSITSIGNDAFWYCTGLTEITLPNSMTSIGAVAFAYCESLSSITSLSTVPPPCEDSFSGVSVNNSFNGVPTTCTLYVPLGTAKDYSEAKGWSVFLNIVEVDFNMELYDALFDEIYIVLRHLSDIWETIRTVYPYTVDYTLADHDSIREELAELLVLLQDALRNTTLDNAFADAVRSRLEEIDPKIDEMLEKAQEEWEILGIDHTSNPQTKEIVGYYTISGMKITAPQKGINIIHYSDGTTKKMLIE